MKTRPLKGYYGSVGCEVYDIDLATADDDEIMELGRIVEDQLTVFIDREGCNGIDTKRHFEIHEHWGTPCMGLVHQFVIEGRLRGPHWDAFLEDLIKVGKASEGSYGYGSSIISYRTGDDGQPIGLFSTGELDWHADMAGLVAAPRTLGLHSISDTAGSRTDFLQTHDMWIKLSDSMQSELKELQVKHTWRPEAVTDGAPIVQQEIARMNTVASEGQVTNLYSETASGRPGIRFPAYSFDGFVGMSDLESWKLYAHLCKLVYDPAHIYQHEWKDGQVMYFDQEICVHRRPTNIQQGNKRKLCRTSTYMDKLYPNAGALDYVYANGKKLTLDEYAEYIDGLRLKEYEAGQTAAQLKEKGIAV